MSSYRVLACVAVMSSLLLWGCTRQPREVGQAAPWRIDEEQLCLASGQVRESRFIYTRASLGGPGSVCGAQRPFEMAAAQAGAVFFSPPATLRCPMVPAVEHWMTSIVQPAARSHFGQPVVEIKVAASYSCRPRNGIAGGRLSEHGLANALDVSAFRLADGRWVSVREGWSGPRAEAAFLRSVHQGSCSIFTTVLGPLADAYHRDHFHLDLARHGRDGTFRVCR